MVLLYCNWTLKPLSLKLSMSCFMLYRPEMVVGWYHSHPGFGCWLSGVDINTQQVITLPLCPVTSSGYAMLLLGTCSCYLYRCSLLSWSLLRETVNEPWTFFEHTYFFILFHSCLSSHLRLWVFYLVIYYDYFCWCSNKIACLQAFRV